MSTASFCIRHGRSFFAFSRLCGRIVRVSANDTLTVGLHQGVTTPDGTVIIPDDGKLVPLDVYYVDDNRGLPHLLQFDGGTGFPAPASRLGSWSVFIPVSMDPEEGHVTVVQEYPVVAFRTPGEVSVYGAGTFEAPCHIQGVEVAFLSSASDLEANLLEVEAGNWPVVRQRGQQIGLEHTRRYFSVDLMRTAEWDRGIKRKVAHSLFGPMLHFNGYLPSAYHSWWTNFGLVALNDWVYLKAPDGRIARSWHKTAITQRSYEALRREVVFLTDNMAVLPQEGETALLITLNEEGTGDEVLLDDADLVKRALERDESCYPNLEWLLQLARDERDSKEATRITELRAEEDKLFNRTATLIRLVNERGDELIHYRVLPGDGSRGSLKGTFISLLVGTDRLIRDANGGYSLPARHVLAAMLEGGGPDYSPSSLREILESHFGLEGISRRRGPTEGGIKRRGS